MGDHVSQPPWQNRQQYQEPLEQQHEEEDQRISIKIVIYRSLIQF